jgi:hypothetical protein
MSALKTIFGWLVFLFTLWTSMAFGAIPFSAPATFGLEGRTLAVSGALQTVRNGTLQMAIDPNPSPVTGQIQINIVEGILLEEFGASLIAVGTFSGQLSPSGTGAGTWVDDYGCYGTFTVTRQE